MAVGDQRKADHLRIAADPGVQSSVTTGLEHVRLVHRALPPGDMDAVDLTTSLFGATLQAPLVVSAMTGGTPEAAAVNGRLLRAAAQAQIALVLGSGRRLLEDPDLLRTYRVGGVRSSDRPPLLLANLGAVQLVDAPERAEALVDLLDADGLSVHLNPLQEAVQPEGQPRFAGALEGIAAAVQRLGDRPVVVKEVGFGLSGADVALLAQAGVAGVDVAGAGGTNWALIEGRRDEHAGAVAAAFAGWGLPTVEALAEARAAAPGLPVLASGGVRDGVEAVKCLALGAAAVGLAAPLLRAAQADRAGATLRALVDQVRVATWLTGASATTALGADHLR